MNKQRRQQIRDLTNHVKLLLVEMENLHDADGAKDDAVEFRDAEQETFDALGERAQDGDKGQGIAANVEKLDEAVTKLEAIADAITTIKDDLQETIDALEAVE